MGAENVLAFSEQGWCLPADKCLPSLPLDHCHRCLCFGQSSERASVMRHRARPRKTARYLSTLH